MKRVIGVFCVVSVLVGCASGRVQSDARVGASHVVVYQEAGRYCGWPANHGIWSWEDEIVVGFELGYHRGIQPAVNPLSQTKDTHAIDYERPAEHLIARSLDGGETWTVERPPGLRPPPGKKVARVPTGDAGKPTVDCPGDIDFLHPDFAMTLRMLSYHVGPSRFYYTLDRGKTWSGPFKLPNFGQKGIAARTDYLVTGRNEMLSFLTAAKSNSKQGRIICVRTQDGGGSWEFVSYVGPEPKVGDKANMPSTVRLSPESLLMARRRVQGIDLYRSDDNGQSWRQSGYPVPEAGKNGNPPHMIRLRDGRLVLTYGYRSPPYGIRARVSRDDGATWSDEIILRGDGGYWDVGYVRSVERSDGKVVSVYYFTDAKERERYISATIWDPP